MNAVLLERDRFVDAPVQERRFLFLISIQGQYQVTFLCTQEFMSYHGDVLLSRLAPPTSV